MHARATEKSTYLCVDSVQVKAKKKSFVKIYIVATSCSTRVDIATYVMYVRI
jgi:hypothetical protein